MSSRTTTGRSRRRRPRRAALLASATVLVALAGCSSSGSSESGAGIPAQQTGFTGTTLDGARFDSTSLAGKPRVLWFWAPWCTICRAESSDVAKEAAAFKGKVTFVGVPGRGKVPQMRQFVSQTGTGGFQHVSDQSGSLWKQFGVSSQPSFVFVDAQGHATRVTGSLDAAELKTRLTSLQG